MFIIANSPSPVVVCCGTDQISKPFSFGFLPCPRKDKRLCSFFSHYFMGSRNPCIGGPKVYYSLTLPISQRFPFPYLNIDRTFSYALMVKVNYKCEKYPFLLWNYTDGHNLYSLGAHPTQSNLRLFVAPG